MAGAHKIGELLDRCSAAVHVFYFAAISCVGWGLLTALKVRAPHRRPRGIDMFFTAVSAATVSSMSAVEMEVFSNGQLLVLTALMFIGGEVFVSLVGLASKWFQLREQIRNRSRVDSHDGVELETPTTAAAGAEAADADDSRQGRSQIEFAQIHRGRRTPIRKVSAFEWFNKQITNSSRVDSHNGIELQPLVMAEAANADDSRQGRSQIEFAQIHQDRRTPIRKVRSTPDVSRSIATPATEPEYSTPVATTATEAESSTPVVDEKMLQHDAARLLFYVVLAILLVVHIVGAVAVAAYMHAAPGARRTLRRKALDVWTFAVFTTVSTFSNCGYMPTNENMIVFKRDVPLQLLLAPQALVGNTLFPPLLAACVWAMGRKDLAEVTKKGREATGYHLLEARRCWMLAGTVVGFIAVQAALVCAMEWGSALQGLSAGEKVANALFLAVNSRHTGEATLDLSKLAPRPRLFVLMIAYGNVGFSMGYNCIRQINPDQLCTHRWTGFAGRWSESGKLILIIVMFFGRLKKFSMKGGKAWKLG